MKRLLFLTTAVLLFGTAAHADVRQRFVDDLLTGKANGSQIQNFVDVQRLVPSRYNKESLEKAAQHSLAANFIAERKIWAERGTARAIDLAEYQALTGKALYEDQLVTKCNQLIFPPWTPTWSYDTFVKNPEPDAIMLARIAALNPKARDVLRPYLEFLLERIRTGTHGWSADWGKITDCRVAIQQALDIPCNSMDDYGRNIGARKMLGWTRNGYFRWMVGSVWYRVFNDPISPICQDARHLMTADEIAAADAVYFFAFHWQVGGISPLAGEDKDFNRVKPYVLWTGWSYHWQGDDEISIYMRWRALHELSVPVHFDDLFCPEVPDWCPPKPPLLVFNDWSPFAHILRDGDSDYFCWWANQDLDERVDGTHLGTAIPFSIKVAR